MASTNIRPEFLVSLLTSLVKQTGKNNAFFHINLESKEEEWNYSGGLSVCRYWWLNTDWVWRRNKYFFNIQSQDIKQFYWDKRFCAAMFCQKSDSYEPNSVYVNTDKDSISNKLCILSDTKLYLKLYEISEKYKLKHIYFELLSF